MKIILTVIFGFLAGVVGGMGMGGGTFLIPLLGFLDYEQRVMQAMNLISFLPMACVALAFHFKNKLVRTKGVLWIIIPAALLSVPGALLTGMAGPKALKICFGVFFLAIGGAEIFGSAKKMKDKDKNKKA